MSQNMEFKTKLANWLAKKGLEAQSFEHWDEVVTRLLLVDSGQDIYEFSISAASKDNSINSGNFQVSVSLVKRGSRKHHAFYRERARFTYTTITSESHIFKGLDACYLVVTGWITEAGHELLPRA